jgi:hypothetical protein
MCPAVRLSKSEKEGGLYRKRIIGKLEPHIPHNMITFADNTVDLEKSKKLNGTWSNTALGTNQTRTFIFKLHSNTAGFNVTFLVTRTKRTKHHYIYSLNALQ